MRKKEKNREVNVPMPRIYFFFSGAFFLAGFLATTQTSGYYIWQYFVFKIF
jgi:hypothetical protein